MKNDVSECRNPWLCTALGFFLPIVGLIVSAVIGKGLGVRHALGGIGLRWVLVIGGCLFVFRQPDPFEKEQAVERRAETVRQKTWKVSKGVSPIDDSPIYTLMREAETPVSGGFRRECPVLILRHKEGRNRAYIAFPMYLSNRSVPVTIRFDKDEAITDDWKCSTDGKSVFSPYPFSEFFGMVLDSKRLVVRLVPFGGNPETVTFDLSGLSAVLDSDVLGRLNESDVE